jgi:hypothetical protein
MGTNVELTARLSWIRQPNPSLGGNMKCILVTTILLFGAVSSGRAQNSVAAKAHATQGDQAAKLIGKCGKPDKDFTKIEGGQPIRHIIYKKQNVELM